MNNLLPNTTTATELQRDYKSVMKKVKRAKQPFIILSNNKPSGVLMDYQIFQKLNIKDDASQLKKKEPFTKYSKSWSSEEARIFDKTTESLFEQIDPEIWK